MIVAVLALVAMPLSAQDFEPNRTPDGKPDLSGVWQALNEANYDLELHMAKPAMHLREGPYGPLPTVQVLALGAVGAVPGGLGVIKGGGKIPYTSDALEKKNWNQENWVTEDPEIKCFLPGVPRATYMPHPFQIFQTPDTVFVAYQYAGAVRHVYMEDPGLAPIDSWMGQSYGQWDGDTLVIEVTGLHPDSWLDRAGNHHSDQMKVTERYTLVTDNHIHYEATIEDPATFTEAWTIEMPLYRRVEPNAQLMDFRCVEFVEEVLYGQYRRNPLDRPDYPMAEGR
ncbi:MAG: hypothetical protein VYE73_01585 [Acidobacteriota bacterium]|nr:hypothetical protein [Acidobacteriota bacterium]